MQDMFRDTTLGTIFVGTVINNNDPLKLGRIKVKIFGKNDQLDEQFIPWSISYSQLSSGTLMIPKEGEIVNVFFENGDENIPFYNSIAKLNDDVIEEISKDYPLVWSVVYDNKIGEDKTLQIFYTESQGLIIKKNESFIQIKNDDDSILIQNKKDDKTIHLNKDGISIGSQDKSDEPAVLADTLEKLLNDFIKDLGNVGAIPTGAGPSGTLNSSPQWGALVIKFNNEWKKFKSKIVTLD